MKNYIYANLWTQELEDAIERSPTKPLVEEMFYKYGVKVMAMEEYKNQYNWDTNKYEDIKLENNFIVTLDGFPMASLYTQLREGKTIYGIFSPRIRKERGSDNRDRCSYSSVKLSQLIKTIEKKKVMEDIEYPVNHVIAQLINRTKDALEPRRGSKYIGYREEEKMQAIHKILKSYLNNQPIQSISQDLIKVSKELVDLFDRVDENNEKHSQKVLELFSSFYLLYTDASEGIVVGKYTAEFKKDESGDMQIVSMDEIVGSERVINLEDHEDFADFGGVLTMFKVHIEQIKDKQNIKLAKNLLPIIDGHFEDFDISTYYRNGYNQFEGTFLCLPTSK